MPKVSIIVPIYNVSKYLSSCLNSLVSQSLKDIEIICIEDKSTDNSKEILKSYEKNYPHLIKAIYLEENKGLSHARNEGLKVANGKYIGFVDSDDLVSRTMFEDFSKTLEEYHLPILVGSCFQIKENDYLHNEVFMGGKKSRAYIENYLKSPDVFFFETPSVCEKLFLHDFIEHESFLEGVVYEDIAFTYPLLLKAKQTVQLLQSDYAYRQNKKSIMASAAKKNLKILDMLKIYEKCAQSKLPSKEKNMLLDRVKHAIYITANDISSWQLPIKEQDTITQFYLQLADYKVDNFFRYRSSFPKRYYIDIQKFLLEKLENENTILNESDARHIEDKLIREIKR